MTNGGRRNKIESQIFVFVIFFGVSLKQICFGDCRFCFSSALLRLHARPFVRPSLPSVGPSEGTPARFAATNALEEKAGAEKVREPHTPGVSGRHFHMVLPAAARRDALTLNPKPQTLNFSVWGLRFRVQGWGPTPRSGSTRSLAW